MISNTKTCIVCDRQYETSRRSIYCSHECLYKRKLSTNFDKNGDLKCSKCSEYKNLSEFDGEKRNKYRNFKANQCKVCAYKSNRARAYRSVEDLDRCCNNIIKSIATRKKNKKSDIYKESNVTFAYIKNLYAEQDGKCAISGINMTLFYSGKGRIDTNISIDRINNKEGYVVGNVQLVCLRVNIMKNTMTEELLYNFCKKIVFEYEKEKVKYIN